VRPFCGGPAAVIALVAVTLAAAACSRADLDAITHIPGTDGGTDLGTDLGTDVGADSATPVTCPSPTLPPGDGMQTVQVSGASRSYFLHVPSTYDGTKPVPLIVDFHAITPSSTPAMQQRNLSTYPDVVDPEGVVMAFPSGLMGPSGVAWNVGPCCVANVDDVAFTRALVAQISMTACIDPKRVYATGFSMGGGMAHYIACHAADIFAAVAPSAFDLLQENAVDCLPPRPITVISFRGTADNVVPYGGGFSSVVPMMPVTFLGAQGTFQKWAAIDQCGVTPSAPDANGCSTYPGCQGGVEVILCTNQGGGPAQGNAAIAWPILKRHPLP
jgi:polyhydroxybutyrate depolymerase